MSNKTPKKVVQPDVMLPANWDVADAAAIQAVMRGDATEHQQRRAMTWIVWNAAGTYDLEYRSESRDHAFSSGRRFVGLQIVKLLNINTAAFKEKK